jgi:hypothetical protein
MSELALAGERVPRLPIVDKAIEVHGGAQYGRSRIRFTIQDMTLPGVYTVLVDRDAGGWIHEATVKTREKKPTEIKMRASAKGIARWQDGEEVELDQDTAGETKRLADYGAFFGLMPLVLNDPEVLKEHLGTERWNGKDLEKVKVIFPPGKDKDDVYLFWFDPKSAELEQFSYAFDIDGGGLRVMRASKRHKVGGILFTEYERRGAPGTQWNVDQVTPELTQKKLNKMPAMTLEAISVEPSEVIGGSGPSSRPASR